MNANFIVRNLKSSCGSNLSSMSIHRFAKFIVHVNMSKKRGEKILNILKLHPQYLVFRVFISLYISHKLTKKYKNKKHIKQSSQQIFYMPHPSRMWAIMALTNFLSVVTLSNFFLFTILLCPGSILRDILRMDTYTVFIFPC